MLHSYINLQANIASFVAPIDNFSNNLFFWIFSITQYFNNIVLLDFLFFKKISLLTTLWFNPLKQTSLYNFLILDTCSYNVLWLIGDTFTTLLFTAYNFFFQLEKDCFYLISPVLVSKQTNFILLIDLYVFNFLFKLLKFSFFFIFFINFIFFSRYNFKSFTWSNNSIMSKFFILFETEEELGSIDDGLYFITLFIFIFSWYFLITYFFINNFKISLIFLTGGFLVLIFFVLLIPLSVLLDFGLAFASYIRGAGSSTNVVVEVIFDLIGTLVVFTRFLVQNIRFALIFGAYFELFEWIYNSPFILMFNSLFNITDTSFVFSSSLNFSNLFYTFSVIIFGIINYLYYFVHLLILLFIQLGAYFLISFWLFFFFYTSFVLNKYERVFFFKKYIVS